MNLLEACFGSAIEHLQFAFLIITSCHCHISAICGTLYRATKSDDGLEIYLPQLSLEPLFGVLLGFRVMRMFHHIILEFLSNLLTPNAFTDLLWPLVIVISTSLFLCFSVILPPKIRKKMFRSFGHLKRV